MGSPLLARASRVSGALDARTQILAVGREDRQCLRRPEFILLLSADRRFRRDLSFRCELGFAVDASWNKAQPRTIFFVGYFVAFFVILRVGIDLPEIVKLGVSQNIVEAQHSRHQ